MLCRIVLVIVGLVPVHIWAQARTVHSASAIAERGKKDPQAMAVIAQGLAANGGQAALEAVKDFKATGKIHYYWIGEPVSSVTILGRGVDDFRLETVLDTGVRKVTASHGSGMLQAEDGKKTRIPNAVNLGALTLPILKLASAAADPSLSILCVDNQESVSGSEITYDIRVQRALGARFDPDGSKARSQAVDYLIDAKTFMIVEVRDNLHPRGNTRRNIEHVIALSDFRAVNGIVVPFAITERAEQTKGWDLTLSAITFNSGLDDSAFTF